jgi:hypothetical protein
MIETLLKSLEKWAFKYIKKFFIFHFNINNDISDLNEIFSFKYNFIYIFIAFLIGFILTLPPVFFEIYFDVFTDFQLLTFLSFSALMIFFVLLEFYFLYLLGFYLFSKWGMQLYHYFNLNNILSQKDFIKSVIRIIMELPEPRVEHKHNLNPYEHSSSKILILSLIYKIKVFASNFIAKVILKKILIRSSFRGYVSLIAAPITGFWDAFVFYRVMSITKYKIFERIFLLKILSQNNKLIYSVEFQKIIRLRYYLFGEYNVNLDYILSKTFSEKFLYSKKEVKRIDYLNNDINLKFLSILFAFKYQIFNHKEIEIIKKFALSENIKYIKQLIKKSDLEGIYSFLIS